MLDWLEVEMGEMLSSVSVGADRLLYDVKYVVYDSCLCLFPKGSDGESGFRWQFFVE